MKVRPENKNDTGMIETVINAAFETSAEANLVTALREHAQPVISLVAEDGGDIIGHIMFSPVVIEGHETLKLMGLAPIAVSPGRQEQGVGTELVNHGLEACKRLGCGAVVVLGHPGYYCRFGFMPGTRFGIKSEYDVPEDVFMVKELRPGYLDGVTGTARYHSVFSSVLL